MPTVSRSTIPATFYGDTAESLAWLYSRQLKLVQGWEANALETGFPVTSLPGAPCVPTTPPFVECGIVSQNDLSQIAQTTCESIAMVPPGILMLGMDDQLGPDGCPIDLSPIGLPFGNLFPPVLPVTSAEITAYYEQMYNNNPNGAVINGVTYPVLPGLTDLWLPLQSPAEHARITASIFSARPTSSITRAARRAPGLTPAGR